MQTTKSFSTLQQILLNTLFHFPEIEHEIMGFLADNRLDLQNNNISLIFKRDPFSRILFDNDN